MLFVIGVLLAIFVLPQSWGLVAIAVGAALDVAETGAFLWWSGRRKELVGVQSLVGKRGLKDFERAGKISLARGEIRLTGLSPDAPSR